jgi:hypothetical protein
MMEFFFFFALLLLLLSFGFSITLNVILYRRYRGTLWFVFFLWHHLAAIKKQGWAVSESDKKTIDFLLEESKEVAGNPISGWDTFR